jgi:Septum formation
MDRSAEDGGSPPTAVAPGPAAPHPVAVPRQRSSSTGTSSTGTSSTGTSSTGTSSTGTSSTGTSGASSTDTPPGPPDPPGQQPGAPRRTTDGVAVAALVSGIIPAIPVTLVLGPLALIRVGRSGARGRALAITGLVLAGLWIVAGAIVAAAIITRPPPPKPVTLPPVFSLRAGQCLDSGASGTSGVHVLSCGQAHDAEVFATFRVAGSRYPGAAALQQRAGQGCVTRLAGYLNPQLPADSLAQSYIYPGAGAWSAGERTVVCTVHSTSGPLVGSVRAAAP